MLKSGRNYNSNTDSRPSPAETPEAFRHSGRHDAVLVVLPSVAVMAAVAVATIATGAASMTVSMRVRFLPPHDFFLPMLSMDE